MKSLSAWRREAKTLAAGGRRLAYWTAHERDEAKPLLLLIHGYPTSSFDWRLIWRDLAAHFRLAALDMLGFGLSEKPRNIPYTLFMQADFQEALLEHLGAGEAHILAHDYGDTVAQELLARHNEGALSFSLKSVAFLNGGIFPEQHRALPIQQFGMSPFGSLIGLMMNRWRLKRAFDEIFGPETKASEEEIAAQWSLLSEGGGRFVLHKLLRYIPERRDNRERWVGALKAAALPMRLIDGGADPVSGAHLYHHYRQEIADADAILLETIGHYPQIEAPFAVTQHFLDFHRRIGTIAG